MRNIAALTLVFTATAFASNDASIWNTDGDLIMSPAENRSVLSSRDIFVNSERVLTESEMNSLLSPILARILAMEAQVLGSCASQPCQNGAACSLQGNSFVCSCAAFFTGALCDQALPTCDSSPCQNGGVCQSATDSYTCTCVSGYSGSECESDVTECDSLPCQNGGSCSEAQGKEALSGVLRLIALCF